MTKRLLGVLVKIHLGILWRLILFSMFDNHKHGTTSFGHQGHLESFIFRSLTSPRNRLKKGVRTVLILVLERLIRTNPFLGTLINQGPVYREEESGQIGRLRINPPPNDARCQVCGKNISELKPFGGPVDPLVGDFSGEPLVRRWRPEGPYNPEAQKSMGKGPKRDS